MSNSIAFVNNAMCWLSICVVLFALAISQGARFGWYVGLARRRALKFQEHSRRRNVITNWQVNGLLTGTHADMLIAELCPEPVTDAVPPEAYAPPALDQVEEGRAHGAALKLATIQKYPLRVLRFGELILENMRLLKEVNDLRSRLGIPPREVHDVRS